MVVASKPKVKMTVGEFIEKKSEALLNMMVGSWEKEGLSFVERALAKQIIIADIEDAIGEETYNEPEEFAKINIYASYFLDGYRAAKGDNIGSPSLGKPNYGDILEVAPDAWK